MEFLGNFNPPTPRGVGQYHAQSEWQEADFNPPTPRGVGRLGQSASLKEVIISIHPPREGWDPSSTYCPYGFFGFQSTHTARGGTSYHLWARLKTSDFNPPTPRGVGPAISFDSSMEANFNPPTPRGVGPVCLYSTAVQSDFNPPTPRGVGQQTCTKQHAKNRHNRQKKRKIASERPRKWGVP